MGDYWITSHNRSKAVFSYSYFICINKTMVERPFGKVDIIAKFGDAFAATERTFRLGIDRRITKAVATRFRNHRVFESCTGAGFSTISLAEQAESVVTFEIDAETQAQAIANIERSGLTDKVNFVLGDCMSPTALKQYENFTAAFLDPDWAVTGPDHIIRFRNSNMEPPADKLVNFVFEFCSNVALIMPIDIPKSEFAGLPNFELAEIFLSGEKVLHCLFFGALRSAEKTSVISV